MERSRISWLNALLLLPVCVGLLAISQYPRPSGGLPFLSKESSPDVSTCPGYEMKSMRKTTHGLIASLALAGEPCNSYGSDIEHLTVQVSYESQSRLHVHIYDAAQEQYVIPDTLIPRPTASKEQFLSDLEFNFESYPFEFWITRRSDPDDAVPLFDTRVSSLPRPADAAPSVPEQSPSWISSFSKRTQKILGFNTDKQHTPVTFDSQALIFQDRFLQVTSALPSSANIYGLGEVLASSGFRRDLGGTVQPLWARDIACPIDANVYGVHPMYLDHRYNPSTKKSASHGVFILTSAGGDVVLQTTPSTASSDDVKSFVQYRMIGGTLDFYFMSGPTPIDVIEQYSEIVGRPAWMPDWGFGFHLCRWGYDSLDETKRQVQRMKEANIPLETMWNDIDSYLAYRDFTTDTTNFPAEEMKAFTQELARNGQHYIPILDAGIPVVRNDTDIYDPYTSGVEKNIFIKNSDGSLYLGQVWPGYSVFADWTAKGVEQWWEDGLRNWTHAVEWSGIWLDMNEASSFCEGSCGSGKDPAKAALPFPLPGEKGNLILDFPEGYNVAKYGTSGNMSVNGQLTYEVNDYVAPIAFGMLPSTGRDPWDPRYHIHNGFGRLSWNTIQINATHQDGSTELDVHNLWGMSETRATYLALRNIKPDERPFIISRSTFPSSGRWGGHWLGDNFSTWKYMYLTIQGMLQFQLFQIPMVGADTCGFVGNSNEELCNRWMQLGAFTPFYRNHNIRAAIGQEPYRWDSVAEASRKAIAVRYALLPYWTSLFAAASLRGTPPIRALFFEFHDEPELFGIDRQWLVGRDILVTPVLNPNVTSVKGVFPGRGKTIWRDWYTHEEVQQPADGSPVELDAPLSHIPVHIRGGSIILLRSRPGYTIRETRESPFKLLVSLSGDEKATGWANLDDGVSLPVADGGRPSASRTELSLKVESGRLTSQVEGGFKIGQKLEEIVVLGVRRQPKQVTILRRALRKDDWSFDQEKSKLVINIRDGIDLNAAVAVAWA